MKGIRPIVTVYGEILWDIFEEGKRLGGAPFNVAFHLNNFDIQNNLISAVGKDTLGHEIRHFITRHGCSDEYLQERLAPTGTANVDLSGQEPVYDIKERVAWDSIVFSPVLADLVNQSDVLVFGTLCGRGAASRNTLTTLFDQPTQRVFDLNLRPPHVDQAWTLELAEKADVIKVNEHELQVLSDWLGLGGTREKQIQAIAESTDTPVVLASLGAEGGMLWQNNELFVQPGIKVKVKDTVGAGDAFLAGFLSQWLHDEAPARALEMANAAGAYTAAQWGAIPAYTQEWLQKMLKI